jgi:hypothetical protein
MNKTMRWFSRAFVIVVTGGLLLGPWASTASAQRVRGGIVLVRPVPVFDPFFYYGYGYGYPNGYGPQYAPERYGYVKIDTHHQDKDAAVYVDGGYAAPVEKAKKFALRPGTHDIELRSSDNRTIFQERIAVLIGKTTKVDVPSDVPS